MEHTTLKSDTPFRQANTEHLSTNRSTRTPKCMVEIPVDPSRQSLTDEEVKNIKKELIKINELGKKYYIKFPILLNKFTKIKKFIRIILNTFFLNNILNLTGKLFLKIGNKLSNIK